MRRWVSPQRISTLSNTDMSTISPSQLNDLLQLCSKSKALIQGKQVHQQITIHGFTSNPFMTTKLIQMYVDCNNMGFARTLFDKLPQPNLFAWTAILSFYSRNYMFKECLQTYISMKKEGIRPDHYVFPKVLRACAQAVSLKEGISIHNDVIRSGAELNPEVGNSLVDMYSKCGEVQMARKLFDEMVQRDLLSWNVMISCYVSNGFLDLAVKLMGLMRLDDIEPDLISWNLLIDAYCRMGLCEEASKVFGCIEEPNIISWTTLISGYSRAGKHEIALRIFRDMMCRRVVVPDSDALSSILVSCRLVRAESSGREVHGYGVKTQNILGFYSSAGPALLTMYAECRRVSCARYVFNLMNKSDVVTWNAMILGFAHLHMSDSALICYGEMQSRGIDDDQITVSTLLPVCDLRSGKQIHAHIRKKHFDSSVMVWNALINMYSKCGCIDAAYTVFTNIDIKDEVSWNTMISGYGMHGHGIAALELLQKMRRSSLRPNSTTITSALSACCHSGLVDEGLHLFNSLTVEFGITPTMEQFTCVVGLLARAGQLEEAVVFIDKMAIKPDKRIWGALLAACQEHQNVTIGKLAAEQLFSLEPENSGNYVTLSNIYARDERWGDAMAVRKLMEARGLVKPFGSSWLDSEN